MSFVSQDFVFSHGNHALIEQARSIAAGFGLSTSNSDETSSRASGHETVEVTGAVGDVARFAQVVIDLGGEPLGEPS